MSAELVHSEELRRMQVELEQLRKLADDLTEFRGLRFSVQTSRGSCYSVTVSEALAFVVQTVAKCLQEAGAGASSPGVEYFVPLHYVDIRATRKGA